MKNIIFSMAVILTVVLNACAQDTIPIMRGVKLSTVKRTALDTGVLIPIQKNGKWEQTSVGDVILKTKEAIDPQLSLKASQTDLSNLDLQLRSDFATKQSLIDSTGQAVKSILYYAFGQNGNYTDIPITNICTPQSMSDGWHYIKFHCADFTTATMNMTPYVNITGVPSLYYTPATNSYSNVTYTNGMRVHDGGFLGIKIKNGTIVAHTIVYQSGLYDRWWISNLNTKVNAKLDSVKVDQKIAAYFSVTDNMIPLRDYLDNFYTNTDNFDEMVGQIYGDMNAFALQTALNDTAAAIRLAIGTGGGSTITDYIPKSTTIYSSATALGDGTYNVNAGWSDVTAMGKNSLASNTKAGTTGFGAYTLVNNNGDNNSAFGRYALTLNTTGFNNSAFGNSTLQANTSGQNNSAFGNNALSINSTGYQNSAFGSDALKANTNGQRNSAFGASSSLVLTSATDNSTFGFESGRAITLGYGNAAFGSGALRAITTTNNNSAFGTNALYVSTGSNNNAFGTNAMRFATTGSNNSAFGMDALRALTTGGRNVAIGDSAGSLLTTGNFNIILGNGVQAATATGDYQLNIGGWITGNNGAISIPKSLVVNSSNVVREADDISASYTIVGNGQTINITDNKVSDVGINSSGTIGTLTIELPSATKDGKLITVHFNNRIGVTQGHKILFNVSGTTHATVVCDDASLDLVPAAVNSYEYDFNTNGTAVQPTFTLRYSAQTGKYHLISRMF